MSKVELQKSQSAERMGTIADELAGISLDIQTALGHNSRWAQQLEGIARELRDLAEHLPAWPEE